MQMIPFRFNKEFLGRCVREARLGIGLSLRDLAARAGISAPHVCRIEGGEWDIRLSTLMKVAFVLGSSPGELIEKAVAVDELALIESIRKEDEYADLLATGKSGSRRPREQLTLLSLAQFCAMAAYILKSSNPIKVVERIEFPVDEIRKPATEFARFVAAASEVDRWSLLDELSSQPRRFITRLGFLTPPVVQAVFKRKRRPVPRWGHPRMLPHPYS